MALPLYSGCHPAKQPDSHAGLWFDRFFDRYDAAWQVPKDDSGKLAWIKLVAGKVGDAAVAAYAARQNSLVSALGGQFIIAETDWHFATGLGNNHPVENGFAWHPTLGVPYLTGAAVKGLLRAWCEQWAGFDAAKLRLWFGPSLDELVPPKNSGIEKQNPAAGELIFFDALPTGQVTLKADVMTPHCGKWYEEGDKPPNKDGRNVPADWHSPMPVPFLVVDGNQPFQFTVARRPTAAAKTINLDDVIKELGEALTNIGAGAKTAAGYGRFSREESEEERIKAEVTKLTPDQLAQKLGKERNKTRVALGNLWEKYLEQVISVHGDQIRGWSHSEKTNEKKAYKTVFERGEGN